MSDEQTPEKIGESMSDFGQHLKNSKRVLALVGAGLGVASGIGTYRASTSKWRIYEQNQLSFASLFKKDPGMVWQYFTDRRRVSMQAIPNAGHYALAELAQVHPDFMTLNMNIDGLSSRAGHPDDKIHHIHGNLSTIKCSSPNCSYIEHNNHLDPLVPALSPTSTYPKEPTQTTWFQATLDLLEPTFTPSIPLSELPRCPECSSILRPGIVWFGEIIPPETIESVDRWIAESESIDLVLVIGTSLSVWPAAEYVDVARRKGARVAVVNVDVDGSARVKAANGGWLFQGNSSVLLPNILRPLVGELEIPEADSVSLPVACYRESRKLV